MNRPANVRQDFYDRLAPGYLAPLWEVLKGLVPREPRTKLRPHVWRYGEVRPLLLESGDLLTAQEAERRVLVFENPALPGQSRVTSTLYAGVQLILPGETAPAHRHTAGAIRFVLESEGGYTTVAGERTDMRRGDLVITPSGAFHDHGHAGEGPVIWIDGLDVPIVNFMEAGFSEEYDGPAQAVARPNGFTLAEFGSGLLPIAHRSPFGATSPVFSYPYERARAALFQVAGNAAPDLHVGTALRYANPLDGGWVMATMATWLTHLPAGFETARIRSTDGQVIVVAEGEVEIEIGEETLAAGENDVVVLPGWTWRRLRAGREAVLFHFSDRAMQERLGMWREERG